MKILVTGAAGFIGTNLCEALRLRGDTVFAFDRDTPPERLAEHCREAELVYHLAGVNRPKDDAEFMIGNRDFTATLLDTLRQTQNTAPVMLSSSVQAAADNPYGLSKRAAEELVRAYGRETGAPVWIFRFPGVFGKGCRPNYNNVVATFCHNIARGLPIRVDDPARGIKLLYVDDLTDTLLKLPAEPPIPDADGFYDAAPVFSIPLGRLAERLRSFADGRARLELPETGDALTGRLWATYLANLPEDGFSTPATVHADVRGSFAELLHVPGHGQVSVNVARPGITKGGHFHRTKNEKFLVVSGEGVIRLRRTDSETITEYRVRGDAPEAVDIPPGYTHSIENIGITDLVTVMWASEEYDPARPDTYPLPL